MTLVVGVICRDGIVLAADRQAQDGAGGIVTIGHAVTKITVVGTDSLFAFSGAVAVGQQLCNAAAQKHKEWAQSPVGKAIPDLQKAIREILKDIYAGAQAALPLLEPTAPIAMPSASVCWQRPSRKSCISWKPPRLRQSSGRWRHLSQSAVAKAMPTLSWDS